MGNKNETLKNFSRFASCYDAYCDVQNQAGAKLLSFINGEVFKKILDIGCGTGNYTRLLRKRFPDAAIKAIDICGSMINVAKQKLREHNTDFIVADAEELTFTERFDLITSNACFQWFDSLDEVIARYESYLNKNGIMLFSAFGPLTFCELRTSLCEFYGSGLKISAEAFISIDKLSDILKGRFDVVSIEENVSEKSYSSLWQLLQTIKYTGTRGVGLGGKALSKARIRQLEEVYIRRFDGINATYQIFYCRAGKRDLIPL